MTCFCAQREEKKWNEPLFGLCAKLEEFFLNTERFVQKWAVLRELVESPEFACEVTIQPVDHLGVDAAIIFSDILVIPEAMGLPYQMVEKKGPWFENTVQTAADVERMQVAEADGVRYTIDAIALTKKELGGRVSAHRVCRRALDHLQLYDRGEAVQRPFRKPKSSFTRSQNSRINFCRRLPIAPSIT